MPNKLIAISDIEGNISGFYSFLVHNKVIDENFNWIFGQGHLVLNGDFFDRGSNVTEVLWLIYHLENQAEKSGGKVHFILGNHEMMNLYGDSSYNDRKYIELAKQVSGLSDWNEALKFLYSDSTELGKWLRSKNIVEKIGDIIFVHGGLNILHVNGNYSLKELNQIAKKYYGVEPTTKYLLDERDRVVISGINSPFWDRRLHLDFNHKTALTFSGVNVKTTNQQELNEILRFYNASKIVIGHSVVNDISSDYKDKVIKIDVKHGQNLHSGKTKGIFIDSNAYFIVDDLNQELRPLF